MEEKLRQYEILLLKAKEDFTAGKYLLDGFQNHNLELNLDIIIFHFQQAAEKALKAILDFKYVKFPKNHDIAELVELLNLNKIKTIDNLQILESLTDYAVEGRYSIIHDDIEDADKYIPILDELISFACNTINQTHLLSISSEL